MEVAGLEQDPTAPRRKASKTALRVAALRALHQTVDKPPVFVDPLALRILGPDGTSAVDTYLEDATNTSRLRATLAVRSRLTEDAVKDAVRRGLTQYVVLGAGLDTYAYRHGHAHLRVFEVDHAATQAWKLQCLADAALSVPDTVRHVAVDFEDGNLIGALAESGFEPTRPAIFSMLGVTFYVERSSLLKTFEAVAGCGAGSEVVFDYVPFFNHAPGPIRSIYAGVAARVAAEGEPWITYFEPAELADMLRDAGFSRILDYDAPALTNRYLAGRADRLAMTPLGHVVRASVG